MVPGQWDLPITENAKTTWPILLPITLVATTDYSAKVEIRTSDDPTSTLLLALSSPSSGLTLSVSSGKLMVTLVITEAQADTLVPLIVANDGAEWSLKVTDPASDTLQWIKGGVAITRTPTT